MHFLSKGSRNPELAGEIATKCVLLLILFVPGCSGPLALTETAEEGFFTNGDVNLHYVLDFPEDISAQHPAVVLGHGSGPKTIRDIEGFAERMLEFGFAVLRYDKRGTGESGGHFVPSNRVEVNTAIPEDYATDMAAAARFLRRHQQVDGTRVGLMGESQAGWVIPPAAVKADSIAFMIILSGPVIPLGDVGTYESLAFEQPDLSPDSVMSILEREGRLQGRGFDPAPYLTQLNVPGLWIFGSLDRHVPARANARTIEAMRTESQRPFTVIVYQAADHGLRDVESGKGISWSQDVREWLRELGY